jgi:hypothetical protein
MRYLKTAAFCFLLIGVLLACSYQHIRYAEDQNMFRPDFHTKAYELKSFEYSQLPASTAHITKVYHKYRGKSLQVNFHLISDNHFALIEYYPRAFLSWCSDQNTPSSFLLYQGSRAPPATC